MYFFKKIIHSIILFFVFSNKYSFLKYILYSKAQLSQDIFALSELNYKEKGFLIDVYRRYNSKKKKMLLRLLSSTENLLRKNVDLSIIYGLRFLLNIKKITIS